MRVHPATAALRSNQALQRRSQEAMSAALAAWHESTGVGEVERDLASYNKGLALNDLLGLKAIFSSHTQAAAFVDQFCSIFQNALREQPFGEVPLRHGSSAGFSRLQLMRSGGVLLSLCAYEPVVNSYAPRTVQFTDCRLEEIVISGKARGTFHDLSIANDGSVNIASFERNWRAGDQITLAPCHNARQLTEVGQTFLTLQLTRSPAHARPSCEYRLSDSQLIQQSSGNKRASEQVMALAVLGAMEHQDAVGPMADFACNAAHDPDARWEAVRQALGLNTERGINLLEALSTNATDPLSASARNLREQLLVSQPKLQSSMAEVP